MFFSEKYTIKSTLYAYTFIYLITMVDDLHFWQTNDTITSPGAFEPPDITLCAPEERGEGGWSFSFSYRCSLVFIFK